MSTKFEQLLDYVVNEEIEKANELFHEIVVDKSREIYENLIAEEEDEEEEEVDEAQDGEDEDEVDESRDEDLEDSYSMEADSDDEIGGDQSDEFMNDVETDDDSDDEFGGDDEPQGHEAGEDSAIFDIKNAIAELEAAFAELEAAQESPHTDADFDSDDEFGGDEGGDDEFGSDEGGDFGGDEPAMGRPAPGGRPAMESRRVTREYVEKVGNDWEKNSQKTQGQYAGAGTGDKDGAPKEGCSPVSSGRGKPATGATAANILGKSSTHNEDGTSPRGKVGGVLKKGADLIGDVQNRPGSKAGKTAFKTKVPGHGPEKKGPAEGKAVGAGSGKNSVSGGTNTKSIESGK